MANYKYGYTNEIIIRCSDGTEIPLDPNNPDYVAYREWLDAGGVVDPYTGPPMFGRQPIAPAKDGDG